LKLTGGVSLAAWAYLVALRGAFWRIRATQPPTFQPAPKRVAAIIPARNEEAVISKAISSLLAQEYDGEIRIIVVDDHSSDKTAFAAKQAGAVVIEAAPLPPGWTGKLWAIDQGQKFAMRFDPDYLLLTDADIVHSSDNLRALVARAEAGGLDLVSLMVKLRCRSIAERALIPAFVYFFFQLYPPRWISNLRHSTAGAAGGCMLIRPAALEKIGGIEAIRGELIDDCALAGRVKQSGGKIWLGASDTTHSVREYDTFGEIFRMISRTAFTQLRYSVWWLAATILAMAVVYFFRGPCRLLGSGRWFRSRRPAWAGVRVAASGSPVALRTAASSALSREPARTPWPPRVRSSYRRRRLAAPAHRAPLCTPLRCSTKHNLIGMFDGTSLRRSGFAPPKNAAHAAFTGLFCIRRVYTVACVTRSWLD